MGGDRVAGSVSGASAKRVEPSGAAGSPKVRAPLPTQRNLQQSISAMNRSRWIDSPNLLDVRRLQRRCCAIMQMHRPTRISAPSHRPGPKHGAVLSAVGGTQSVRGFFGCAGMGPHRHDWTRAGRSLRERARRAGCLRSDRVWQTEAWLSGCLGPDELQAVFVNLGDVQERRPATDGSVAGLSGAFVYSDRNRRRKSPRGPSWGGRPSSRALSAVSCSATPAGRGMKS